MNGRTAYGLKVREDFTVNNETALTESLRIVKLALIKKCPELLDKELACCSRATD